MNPLDAQLQDYDSVSKFIKFLLMASIYYMIKHKSLRVWLKDEKIIAAMHKYRENFFSGAPGDPQTDKDYDSVARGLTLVRFQAVYQEWIDLNLEKSMGIKADDPLRDDITLLCFMTSLVARTPLSRRRGFDLLPCYYKAFKTKTTPTSNQQQWANADPAIIDDVVQRAMTIVLKLNMDQYIEDLDDNDEFYTCMEGYETANFVCCSETDTAWRRALLDGVPELLSMRVNEGSYQVVTLAHRFMKFDDIKFNKECVRGLWAGQVQELVFFGSSDSERASIQRLPHIGRNLINQSCDVPIGYPIYVSPLTVSTSSVDMYVGDIQPLNGLKKRLSSKREAQPPLPPV